LAVGATSEIFNVHQGLFCKSAEFFKRAMKPEWMEQRSDPHTIDLSEHCKETVTHYVQWLYTGSIPTSLLQGQALEETDIVKIETNVYMALARAYVFGESVMDIDFKNAVLLKVLEFERSADTVPGQSVIEIVCAGAIPGSSMWRLLVDLMANNISSDPSWANCFDDLPREILVDVIKAMAGLIPTKSGRFLSINDYLEKAAN
jgi:prefoldin beta subunit